MSKNEMSMDLYFDKEGKPIGRDQWCKFAEDPKYRIVKQEKVGDYFLSTIWLGLNHASLKDEPIQIFETMIFNNDEWIDLQRWRYSTLDEAIAGHERALKDLKEQEKRA